MPTPTRVTWWFYPEPGPFAMPSQSPCRQCVRGPPTIVDRAGLTTVNLFQRAIFTIFLTSVQFLRKCTTAFYKSYCLGAGAIAGTRWQIPALFSTTRHPGTWHVQMLATFVWITTTTGTAGGRKVQVTEQKQSVRKAVPVHEGGLTQRTVISPTHRNSYQGHQVVDELIPGNPGLQLDGHCLGQCQWQCELCCRQVAQLTEGALPIAACTL
eukprot:2481390-Rhodomonas_salina.1